MENTRYQDKRKKELIKRLLDKGYNLERLNELKNEDLERIWGLEK